MLTFARFSSVIGSGDLHFLHFVGMTMGRPRFFSHDMLPFDFMIKSLLPFFYNRGFTDKVVSRILTERRIMCGICGIVVFDGGSVPVGDLEPMLDSLSSRGPDSAGVYCHAQTGLGHRRLKIIDLTEQAHQPMGMPFWALPSFTMARYTTTRSCARS